MSLFDTIGYHAFETKKEEIYRALKQGGRNQHMATPLGKAIIDKVTGMMSFPMAIVSLSQPMTSAIGTRQHQET
ncbi:unnamed protein product [Rotaria socialis]|uniref:Uncharacterized protein n=2 Tax=Rotaria socialis TaxID=392032 RepID=A0A818CDY1_9BILA|nr:unnamed protein product [Rotaria socialis]CAF4240065.1 unnamed protein product [Rotaria socialis]CAF4449619.1 unnamed protein product [Rotaria socialis]